MPDITMCSGDGCPMRDDCYRHTADPLTYLDEDGTRHELQSYFVTPPIRLPILENVMTMANHERRNVCEYYTPELKCRHQR